MNVVQAISEITRFRVNYKSAIPDCCTLRSIESHIKINLCERLVLHVERDKKIDCTDCQYRR